MQETILKNGRQYRSHPVDVTVNRKKENSLDFCPNCVQEFGLCVGKRIQKEMGGGGMKGGELSSLQFYHICQI